MIEIAVNGDGRVCLELSLTDRKPAISTTVDYCGATLRCQAIIPVSFRVFRRRTVDQEPKHFGLLRDHRVSLEDERITKLREIHRMATGGEDPDGFLRACVEARMNIVISGGTSSGKTELARRLLWMVEDWHWLALIEDSAELLPVQHNVVSLIAERLEDSAGPLTSCWK